MSPGFLAPPRVEARATPRGRLPWSFTPTALRLFAAGLLLVVLAWLDPRAVVAVAIWDLVVLLAWYLDLSRLPPPSQLVVSRAWSGAVTLAVPHRVHVSIRNEGRNAIEVRATDFVSHELGDAPVELSMSVGPGSKSRAGYDVNPRARGDAAMNLVALRYRSSVGLAERWAEVSLRQTVRVYPDIGEAQRQTFALIRARQIVTEKRRAHAHGLGRDFESLREFQQGDELRDVCWTATARRGRLVTRTYQPERSQTVWIVVDAGRLMRARDGVRTGLDRAVNAAFALAQVASSSGDRVALLTYGRRTQQRIAPGRGPAHLRAVVEALAQTRSEPAEADHARAAAAIMAAQKRRALIVWMTDLAETAAIPEVVESAARLVPRHVLVFAAMRPVDVSSVAAAVPGDARGMYRVMAAQEMIERRARMLGHLRQQGATTLEVPSAELTGTLVDRYLTVKERNLL